MSEVPMLVQVIFWLIAGPALVAFCARVLP